MIRNSKSHRCGILFYAWSGTPLSEWCRLHWHPILRMQFHPCPCIIGQFQGLNSNCFVVASWGQCVEHYFGRFRLCIFCDINWCLSRTFFGENTLKS
jgi:hypothetical protein